MKVGFPCRKYCSKIKIYVEHQIKSKKEDYVFIEQVVRNAIKSWLESLKFLSLIGKQIMHSLCHFQSLSPKAIFALFELGEKKKKQKQKLVLDRLTRASYP